MSKNDDALIEFFDSTAVEYVRHSGDDAGIAAAARVSLAEDQKTFSDKSNAGLINYLMKNRHGSPFEHTSLTFRVQAPIFVFREFHRHRVGWSYNEVSGRYKVLEPKFYIHDNTRPIVQTGTSAHPDLGLGTQDQYDIADEEIFRIAEHAWESYNYMLTAGVANEVARLVLPVNIYSEMYATCNVRSLLHFLSLRVDHPDNTFVTKPLYEIQKVAEGMEAHLAEHFPAVHTAFNENGRVAP